MCARLGRLHDHVLHLGKETARYDLMGGLGEVALDDLGVLLDSCLRLLRCLQFESGHLRGPLISDASQLLPLV